MKESAEQVQIIRLDYLKKSKETNLLQKQVHQTKFESLKLQYIFTILKWNCKLLLKLLYSFIRKDKRSEEAIFNSNKNVVKPYNIILPVNNQYRKTILHA